MRGLLRKDLYMIGKYGKTLLAMSLIFLIAGLLGDGDNFFLVVYPVLFAGVLPVTLISYEERFGWDRYCGVLPLTRRTVVSARYLTSLLSFLALYALTLLLRVAVDLPRGEVRELRELAALLPAFGLLPPSVMLPLTLRFGVEKARIAYYVLIGVVVAMGIFLFNSSADLGGEIGGVGAALVPAVTLLLFVGSWLLSIRLYEKREL